MQGPIGAAKGKQTNTMTLCPPPPPRSGQNAVEVRTAFGPNLASKAPDFLF